MELFTSENLIALLTLTSLEIVLGIDNIVFISILVGKLPPGRQASARRIGLLLAMGMRIALLLAISWVMGLTEPLFTIAVLGQEISGRDLILLLDIVFSLDSVITAVGMARHIEIMVAAVVIAVLVMMAFAGTISAFIERHPTMKMLALSFLLLIGVVLIADGFGQHVSKGYIYFAMAFSLFVEILNLRLRRTPEPPVHLHQSYVQEG